MAAVARAAIAVLWASQGVEQFDGDAGSYIDPARSLIHDLTFVHRDREPEPMFVRTPGFPTVLAAVMIGVGDEPVRWSAALAAMSALVAFPVFSMGRRLFGQAAAWAAVIIILIDPLTISSSTVIMTESTQALLLAFVGLGLVIGVTSGRYPSVGWAMAGVSTALATLVRPASYYLVVVLVAFAALYLARRRASPRALAGALLLLLLPSVLMVGGWQLRNQLQVDSWRFSGIEAVNMYVFRAGDVLAQREGVPFDPYNGTIDYDLAPRGVAESQGSYYNRMYAEGVRIVLSDPLAAARTAVRGAAMVSLAEGGHFLTRVGIDDSPIARWLLRLWMLSLWLVGGVAAIAGWRRPEIRWAVTALVIVIVYVIAISSGPESYSRFRVPAMPLLAVLAGGGACIVASRSAGRLRRAPA